jgi:hypothetical protein
VSLTREDVVFVTDGDPGVVLVVAELDLAAADHGVGAVAVVVVVQRPVVDHGRQVGMVVLNWENKSMFQCFDDHFLAFFLPTLLL